MEAPILLGSGAGSSAPCFTGVLALSFFLSVTIWVTSLESVLRSGNFAELLLYPNIHGVPKWFTALLRAGAGSSQCIDQVTSANFPSNFHAGRNFCASRPTNDVTAFTATN